MKLPPTRLHITIEECYVLGRTSTSQGELRAIKCLLNEVNARDGMTLINTPANVCEVSQGNISITTQERFVYQTIKVRDNISIENIEVINPIESQRGTFTANLCKLPAIKAREQINLNNTCCSSATQ